MNKIITLDLIIENILNLTQQYFALPIINPIILGNNLLDTYFAVLGIVIILSPFIVPITCLEPASPMILYIISTLKNYLY